MAMHHLCYRERKVWNERIDDDAMKKLRINKENYRFHLIPESYYSNDKELRGLV